MVDNIFFMGVFMGICVWELNEITSLKYILECLEDSKCLINNYCY